MVSIVADGLAILTIAVASIPLMQKLAFVAGFWIISIFISVVTLHPIILSLRAAAEDAATPGQRSSTASPTRIGRAPDRRSAIGNMRYGGGRAVRRHDGLRRSTSRTS